MLGAFRVWGRIMATLGKGFGKRKSSNNKELMENRGKKKRCGIVDGKCQAKGQRLVKILGCIKGGIFREEMGWGELPQTSQKRGEPLREKPRNPLREFFIKKNQRMLRFKEGSYSSGGHQKDR